MFPRGFPLDVELPCAPRGCWNIVRSSGRRPPKRLEYAGNHKWNDVHCSSLLPASECSVLLLGADNVPTRAGGREDESVYADVEETPQGPQRRDGSELRVTTGRPHSSGTTMSTGSRAENTRGFDSCTYPGAALDALLRRWSSRIRVLTTLYTADGVFSRGMQSAHT